MQDSNKTDSALLADFQKEILSKVPHVEQSKVVNATRMADVTADFKQCAKTIFGVDLADKDLRVFAKFDSNLLGGSIKARPAINIVHDAIATGKLKRGQTIFEATSGNFGIALGLIGKKLGLNVVTLVSRKLQEGVFDELRNEDIKILNLDMDICPAPGMKGDANLMAAKATAWNVRAQLVELGFDATPFDNTRADIEAVLAKQDIINLAKLLAKIYDGCFCPEQYDNDLNVQAHRAVTGPEIEQQLREQNQSLADYKIVCTFGTGGTSGGLSRYMSEKHGKKAVHVVFPLPDQDVAGIRTKAKGAGLKFYEPDRYANQHEVDFQQARKLLKFFVDKGHDMGESSALALYAAMQMANFGGEGRFVVLVADGIAKYKKALEAMKQKPKRLEVQLNEAASNIKNYNKIVWIHTMYTPKKEGIELIAKELGVDPSQIVVPKAREVEEILMTQKIPKELDSALGSDAKPLLVCMMGNTSLRVAQVLGQKGIEAESLVGGINALSQGKGKQIAELVKMATE